jgi:hypothetical protein
MRFSLRDPTHSSRRLLGSTSKRLHHNRPWTPWRGIRGSKSAPVDGQHELFGFLTTEPNAVVAAIHPKAMPVILTTAAEVDLWLLADPPKALELQRPLPDDALQIVLSGEKEDSPRGGPILRGDQDPMLRFDALRGFQPYHDFV